jgi:hypothetical protein
MESVRKLVSGRLEMQTAGPHPDADLLSSFAEHALPEAERRRVLTHLAECRDCREIVFLSSLPQPADGQEVLVPRPVRWPLALRWGVASIVIIAGVFAARQELFRPARLAKFAPASQLPVKSKVAGEKTPADLESMRENQAVRGSMPVPERERPDLKHMTAKMQRTLTFGQSDEVQVSPAASSNLKADSGAIRDLPLQDRDALEEMVAGEPAAAPKVLTANAKQDKSDVARVGNGNGMAMIPTGTRALAKQAALNPHLAGQVFDVSGAALPNAQVTAVGPVGTEIVTSDAEGRFAFDVLAPGLYSVKAEASGFRPVELKQIEVATNQFPSLTLKLAPAAESETVEVSSTAAAPESSAALHGYSANAAPARKKAQTQGSWKAAPAVDTLAGTVPALQWTLSPTGAVQSSDDGGKTWQTVAVAANPSFRALSAVGRSIWVGGSGGILYHSLDAGRNWTPIVPALKGQKLNSDITRIEFLDSLEGSLSTSNGEVWITHDGGNTWERN